MTNLHVLQTLCVGFNSFGVEFGMIVCSERRRAGCLSDGTGRWGTTMQNDTWLRASILIRAVHKQSNSKHGSKSNDDEIAFEIS